MESFKKIIPNAPQIKRKELRAVALDQMNDDDITEDFLLEGAELSESVAQDIRFLGGVISRAKFDQSKLLQAKLVNVIIENSHLSNARWEKSFFSRVAMVGSKLTGFQAISGKWADVTLKECKIDLALFVLTKMKNIVFEDCILTEADFQECEMENVRFDRCDLSGASFLGARFKNIDLRGSTIEKIKIGVNQFPGIVIEPPQASYLIGATGAKVAWLAEMD